MSQTSSSNTASAKAKFLDGDLMRHIVIMSTSASVGLISMFLVDFLDLFFISLLGQAELAAAVGFAGTLIFLNMSMTIGLMIAMGALAAQRIGRGEPEEARRIATSVVVVSLIFGVVFGFAFWVLAPTLLDFVGATGETKALATRYLRIIVPTLPISAIGMVCSGLLRAHGDAKRAMQATLSAGVVNAVLDPDLIFGLEMGLDGAAFASVGARFAMMATALYPVLKHYGGFARFDRHGFRNDLRPIFSIAAPAVLTNVATPVGAIIVTRSIAQFGDAVVAGYAVLGRLSPLAFCVIFALSGAVGPIIGQNFGAQKFERVRETVKKSLLFTGGYTALIWIILLFSNSYVATAFGLEASGVNLVFWFAVIVAPLFFFNGALFVANASFNNLNRPIYSTWLNWGKNTLGVAPFVWVGANIGGAPGVIIGQALGGVFFGIMGVLLVFRLIKSYERGEAAIDDDRPPLMRAGGGRDSRLG